MKLYFAILFIAMDSAFGFGQTAEFDFLEGTTHKWKKTNEGVQLSHYFDYENTRDVPLTINEAKVSCSCTKVQFPNQPTLPEEIDSILVTFDTQDKFYM